MLYVTIEHIIKLKSERPKPESALKSVKNIIRSLFEVVFRDYFFKAAPSVREIEVSKDNGWFSMRLN